ncbi:radical SAM protein [Parasphaerochaeta coccoides]|uniref:Radical SAM domain protein n=1 Tax=Parasphaerochaeta coccoides (strain ATCC BAA-1237 / DSM 17374 / SPN1) TaxID=760011 RepID=F4GIE0_PARC1|nr:radical SAM protein [Parasphaerochaeta coccoides]AEC01648.1 Radical SAM domain protein [Parasphaerochaeta coccoides DSM 17374]
MKDDLNNYPQKFNVLITSKCNLRCKHCYLDPRQTELSVKDFSSIIDYLKKIKIKELCIEGGEPLCHQYFDQICSSLLNLRCNKKIVTNATLLTEEIVYLIDKTFDTVQVSIDGGTKEEYEIIRGKNSFSKLITGLNYLSKIKDKVQINFVLTALNYFQIDKLFSLAREYGLYQFRFIYVVDFSGNIVPSEEIVLYFISKLLGLITIYKEAKINLVFPERVIHKYRDLLLSNKIENYVGICYAGTVYTVIDSDKIVYPCNFLVGKKPLFSFEPQSFYSEWQRCVFFNNLRNDLQNKECEGCPANINCIDRG